MTRKFLRLLKKLLPNFLPIPYIYKAKLNLYILPKHHWTQYIQKTYEPETFKIIKDIYKKFKINSFWDIGANTGIYSVFISKKYNCYVDSFEPSKKYSRILKFNLSPFNKATNHNFAIGSKNSLVNLFLTEEPGSNYILENMNQCNNSEICQIKNINNLKNIPTPNLVKIDVEGYEYEILKTSFDFFERNKIILIIEIEEEHLRRYSKSKKDITNLLKSRNYFFKRIGYSKNYYCLPSELITNWIELIGIWGSGKSTTINNLKKELKNNTFNKTTHDFFKLKKCKRLTFTFINIVKNAKISFPLLIILIKKYLKGYITKDEILMSEIRSFFSCYSARLYLLNCSSSKTFLWEGEFHLIPFLDFNLKETDFIIDSLLILTKTDSIKFIVLEKTINESIDIIEKDQFSGKNQRFNSNQLENFKEYIVKSLKRQESMIKILEKKGIKIYKFKNLNDIFFRNIS